MGTSASAPYVALVSKFWVAEDVITRSRTASGHVVVGFAAGGPTNILARLVGQWLSERLGQQFVIENRPGAGGGVVSRPALCTPRSARCRHLAVLK
jgi:tripartite-type tricarboxylate transporter receptor subunit TctC